jgi:hypothetical protein
LGLCHHFTLADREIVTIACGETWTPVIRFPSTTRAYYQLYSYTRSLQERMTVEGEEGKERGKKEDSP